MRHFNLTLLLSILIIFQNLNCHGQKSRNFIEDNLGINKIFIQFFPCFIERTQVLVDIQSKEITFYRFGSKEKWYPPSDPADSLIPGYDPNIYIEKMPVPFNVQLNSNEFKYLMDSVILQFNSTELADSISDCCTDGITVYLFTTFRNGNLKETELSNYFSKTHLKFIYFVLDILYKNNIDTTTDIYLKKLKEYF